MCKHHGVRYMYAPNLCLWGQGDIMEGEIIEVFLGKMVQEQELMY